MLKQSRTQFAVTAALIAAIFAAPIPASAAEDTAPPPSGDGSVEAPLDELDEAGREALKRAEELLGMLQKWWSGMPRYAAPEINENGDIIIRRLPPKPEEPSEQDEEGAVDL